MEDSKKKKKNQNKAKPSKANTKTYSSMSGFWGLWWAICAWVNCLSLVLLHHTYSLSWVALCMLGLQLSLADVPWSWQLHYSRSSLQLKHHVPSLMPDILRTSEQRNCDILSGPSDLLEPWCKPPWPPHSSYSCQAWKSGTMWTTAPSCAFSPECSFIPLDQICVSLCTSWWLNLRKYFLRQFSFCWFVYFFLVKSPLTANLITLIYLERGSN